MNVRVANQLYQEGLREAGVVGDLLDKLGLRGPVREKFQANKAKIEENLVSLKPDFRHFASFNDVLHVPSNLSQVSEIDARRLFRSFIKHVENMAGKRLIKESAQKTLDLIQWHYDNARKIFKKSESPTQEMEKYVGTTFLAPLLKQRTSSLSRELFLATTS